MKAPDKIYVHSSAHLGLPTLTAIPVHAPGEQEYIRKDALIEWVNEKLQESVDRLDFHANRALAEIKDKLNSM